MAESVKITPTKGNDNVFKVTLVVTKGKVLALNNALDIYRQHSPVAQDLFDMIQQANPPT